MASRKRYAKVTEHVIAQLAEIVGAGNVLTGDERQNYSRDETPRLKPVLPEAVVKPGDSESIARILRLANEQMIPVTPRGAGSGLSGGAVPIYGGIVLSLERMKRILEIDTDNFTATVEPGVTLADFYRAVDEHGLYYPPHPSEPTATIGGNIATNAGGMRAVKYGVTRQSVLGLEVVLPTGERIETGGKFVKCSTGYDLTQLIIGSEGTLAVVTKIVLKLIKAPQKREVLFVPFNSLEEAISSVPAILQAGILPIGIEFMEKDIIRMVEQHTGKELPLHNYEAYLLIIVEAESEDDFQRILERIGEICLNHGAVDVFVANTEQAVRNLLEAREKFYSAVGHFGLVDIADVVVPRSRIAEFVGRAKELAREQGVPLIAYGHAGDGNVHLHPMASGTGNPEEKSKELLEKIYKLGVSLGGTISGEHGLGFFKKDYLHLAADQSKIELMKRIKRAFDPNNILNPGKILDME